MTPKKKKDVSAADSKKQEPIGDKKASEDATPSSDKAISEDSTAAGDGKKSNESAAGEDGKPKASAPSAAPQPAIPTFLPLLLVK